AILSALAQDPEAFFAQERAFREEAAYPPFHRIVMMKLSGTQAPRVGRACASLAEDLRTLFRRQPEVQVLGPAKANLEKLRGKYGWRVLWRRPKSEVLRGILADALPHFEKHLPAGVALHVDVDPVAVF